MELGKFGVWVPDHLIGDEGADAARFVEELGYGTFWLGASPRLPRARPLLEATEKLVVATGIVNVWAYDPGELAAEYADLARDFPDRLLVGIGIGHPEATSDYTRPLASMREFLDALDAAEEPLPDDRRCLAALGPKMLALSENRSRGAIPYFVPVEHTAWSRGLLGSGPLLAPELAFSLNPDADAGRSESRAYAEFYLGLTNYTNTLRRFGYTDADFAGGGSDRLIDAVVPHGEPARIAAIADAHFKAGADHVTLQPVGEAGLPRDGWAAMAAALNLTR